MEASKQRRSGGTIALVLPSLNGGGAERVTLWLAKEFLARGHPVDLVLARAEGDLFDLVPDGTRVVDLACRRYRSVPLAFARYLRRERPDTVIANMWPLSTVCALGHRLARSGSRMVVVDHVALAHTPRAGRWLRRAILRATLGFSHRHADACIAVSAGVAEDVARLAGIGRDRIAVIHNPVELPAASDDGEGATVWGTDGARRVLTAGRLVPQKNHALLLEAFARLLDSVEARLVILGEGPLRAALERRAAELGIAHAVSLPGFLLHPWPVYAAADLFVLSSDFEGFGNVLVEALACGLPVVSTDCPSGPREILDDGTFGTLVPCGDAAALAEAMRRALTEGHDPEKPKARAAGFTPARAADAYLRAAFGTTPAAGAGDMAAREP